MVVSGRSKLPLIILICFAAVAAISAFGTLAWVTGQLNLAQFSPSFIPIAPLTTLLLVLLGASWFLYGLRPEYSWFRIQAGIVGVLVVMLTSLTIYHALMPRGLNIEELIFPNPATFQIHQGEPPPERAEGVEDGLRATALCYRPQTHCHFLANVSYRPEKNFNPDEAIEKFRTCH